MNAGLIRGATAPVVAKSIDDPAIWGPDLGYDLEFDRQSSTTPPDGWFAKDLSTTTYTEGYGGAAFANFPNGVFNTRGIMRAVPPFPTWTITAKVAAMLTSGSGAGFGFGLFVHNTSSNKTIQFMIGYQLGSNAFIFNMSGNSYVSSLSEVSFFSGMPRFLRLRRNSATSYDFGASMDGISWYYQLGSYDVSAIFTPDMVGIGGLNWGSLNGVTGSCEWLRVR